MIKNHFSSIINNIYDKFYNIIYGEYCEYETIENKRTISYRFNYANFNNRSMHILYKKENLKNSDISIRLTTTHKTYYYTRDITLTKFINIKNSNDFTNIYKSSYENFEDSQYDLNIDSIEIVKMKHD